MGAVPKHANPWPGAAGAATGSSAAPMRMWRHRVRSRPAHTFVPHFRFQHLHIHAGDVSEVPWLQMHACLAPKWQKLRTHAQKRSNVYYVQQHACHAVSNTNASGTGPIRTDYSINRWQALPHSFSPFALPARVPTAAVTAAAWLADSPVVMLGRPALGTWPLSLRLLEKLGVSAEVRAAR